MIVDGEPGPTHLSPGLFDMPERSIERSAAVVETRVLEGGHRS